MLENLRDYSRDIADIYWRSYSDGILVGADISVTEEQINISPGIIKFNGRIYMLSQIYQLPYTNSGKDTMIKVRFLKVRDEADFTYGDAKVFLDEDISLQPGELELGRFQLKHGARLRMNYQDLADMVTQYNTVNMIHVPYGGIEKSTLHHQVLHYFAKEILQNGSQNPYDISFAMLCMNTSNVDRDVILYYLANRQGNPYKEYSNIEIHKRLVLISNEVKKGMTHSKGNYGSRGKIIVD